MLPKYWCIPFYYNEGYGLGDITSEEEEDSHIKSQVESNSIVPLKKYYRVDQKRPVTSILTTTDIFKSQSVIQTDITELHKKSSLNTNNIHFSSLSGIFSSSNKSADQLATSPCSNRNLSVTFSKKLTFSKDSSASDNNTNDCNQDCHDLNLIKANNYIEKNEQIENSSSTSTETNNLNQNSNEKNPIIPYNKTIITSTSTNSSSTTSTTPASNANTNSLSHSSNNISTSNTNIASCLNVDENDKKHSLNSSTSANTLSPNLNLKKNTFSTKSKRLKKMLRKASRSHSPSQSKSYEEDRRKYFLKSLLKNTNEDNEDANTDPNKSELKNDKQALLAPRKQSNLALSLDTYKRILSQKLSKEKAIEIDDLSLTSSSNFLSPSPKTSVRRLQTALSITAPNSASNTPIIGRKQLTKQPSVIDSSLLTSSNSSNGRVCLRLLNDRNTHVLTVSVIQSSKLLTAEKLKLYSKVQLQLTITNKEKAPKYKTTTKEYSDILNFNENFYFPNIEKEDLESCSILMSLYGKETFGSDKLISQANYSLINLNQNEQYNYLTLYFDDVIKKNKSDSNQNLSDQTSASITPTLTSQTSFQKSPTEKAEILIGLKYDALLGNLIVKILKGNNIIDKNCPDKSPNTFVRVILHVDNNESKYQTSVKRSSTSPVYDESFEFNLATYQVENAKLFIYIYSKRLLSSKNLIGCIIFDDRPGHDEYVSHLRAAITSDGEVVQKWHSLIFY